MSQEISTDINGMKPPTSSQSPSTMWNAFEHILLFVTLYVAATSTGLLLHFFVDKWFPNATFLGNQYTYQASLESIEHQLIRGYLAALIVSYPLFVALFLYTSKRIIQNPPLRSSKSRRFLIYVTLILTFVIVLSNIISIVFGLLNGNVSLNFIMHFLVTVGISGLIFGYYFNQIKEDRKAYA